MRRGHARAWMLAGLAVLGALVVLAGWSSVAGAAPGAPGAPGDHDCHWEVVDGPAGNKSAVLKCASGTDPAAVPRDHRPPLPSGCREEWVSHGLGDQGPTREIICDASVPLTDNSTEWIRCRDEHDFWFDDEMQVRIPRDAPQWWKDEIRIESEADEGRGCQIARHVPQETCAQRDIDRYSPGGLVPDQCWGTYPSSNYAVTWEDDGIFDFENKMQGWTGSFMYNIGKGAVLTALWLVGWAFSFDITEYTSFAGNIAYNYQQNIVGPFGLQDIVWYALIVWAGFTTLRGKIGMAAGEIMVAVILAGLATVLFHNREAYMNNVAHLMDETSARLLVAGQTERCVDEDQVPPGARRLSDNDGCDPGEVRIALDPARTANLRRETRPLQQDIHEAFVEQPYAYLNWGKVTTGACLKAQNEIIGVGFNADGWPERHMRRAGCEEEANYNRDQTGEKMLGAFLTMAASLVVAFLLGMMALTVVLSKFLVAVLFAIIPFVALAGILPGGARRMAWSWVSALIQLMLAVVCMSFLLALLMLALDQVLGTTDDLSLVERWTIVLLLVSAVYFARRTLLKGSKGLGDSLANTLTRLTPAGAQSATGNWGGFDLAGIERGAGATARGVIGGINTAATVGTFAGVAGLGALGLVGGPLALASRTAVVRRAEQRVARRNLRNLYEIQNSYRHWDGFKLTEYAPRGGAAVPRAALPGGGAGRGPSPSPAPPTPGLSPSQARGGVILGGAGGGGGAGPVPGGPAPAPSFMLERGAPLNFDPKNRKQLWNYLRDVEHMRPMWDTNWWQRNISHPFLARSERYQYRRQVQMQQQQTADYLQAFRGLRPDVSRRARLVDRRGRQFGWP